MKLYDRLLANEPVRVRLYALLGAVAALAVVYGVADGDQAAAWLGVGAAILGVPAVESARAQVTPVAKLDRQADDAAALP